MSRSQHQSGAYAATPSPDESVLIMPKNYKRDGTKRLVVALHGAGGRATSDVSGGYLFGITSAIADLLGLPVLSIDAGADATTARPNNWANTNCMTAISNAVTWATGVANFWEIKPGAKSGKVILFGVSMGGASAMNWASRNPTLTQACLIVVPAVDVDWAMANTAGDKDIETAYGGTGSTLTTPGKGLYSGATAYVIGDVVQNGAGGRIFRSLASQTGVAPPASGNNAGWQETQWSVTGSFAATSFSPAKNTSPLSSGQIPVQLWWTGNDGMVVPVSGAGVTPPIYTTYKNAIGPSCSLCEIPGSPAHNVAAPSIAASTTALKTVLDYVSLYAA